MFTFLQKYFTSRKIYICVCIVLCVGMTFLVIPEMTFAQSGDSQWANDLDAFYTTILSFISRAWVVPAMLAGKLLSNDWVFGAVVKMDTVLWQLHVIVRTFVNFLVGFWFLKLIAGALISSDIKGLAQDILRLILAAIMIQASRFAIAALVDLGTVATAAIGGLPRTVFEETWTNNGSIIKVPHITVENGGTDVKGQDYTVDGTVEFDIEDILPNADSISGPLLYLGVGILNLPNATILSDTSAESSQRVTVSLLKTVVIAMYVLPIFILGIVCVVRLFWLWIRIVVSPLIMFDRAMSVGGGKGVLGKELADKTLHSSPGDVLGLIFMPTVIVACLSVGIIVSTTMMFVIGQRGDYADAGNPDIGTILPDDGKVTGGVSATSEVEGSLFRNVGYRSAGIVGELILTIFTIAMLWGLVKVGFSVSSVISGISEKIFKAAGTMISSVPIIPVGGGNFTSVGAMKQGGVAKNMAQFAGIDTGARERNNQKRTREALEQLGIEKKGVSYDIDYDASRDIISQVSGSGGGSTGALGVAIDAISKNDEIKNTRQVEYKGNVAKVFDAWLENNGNGKGYDYIKSVLPSDARNMELNEFKKSKYMTRFLNYVLQNPEKITERGIDGINIALGNRGITSAPGDTRFKVKMNTPQS